MAPRPAVSPRSSSSPSFALLPAVLVGCVLLLPGSGDGRGAGEKGESTRAVAGAWGECDARACEWTTDIARGDAARVRPAFENTDERECGRRAAAADAANTSIEPSGTARAVRALPAPGVPSGSVPATYRERVGAEPTRALPVLPAAAR